MSLNVNRKHEGSSRFAAFGELRATLRQLRFPKEFRIERTTRAPELFPLLQKIADRLHSDQTFVTEKETLDTSREELNTFFAELGTGLWRLQQKIINLETGIPLVGMKSLQRPFERVIEALRESRIEIHAHDGINYDPGMQLKVIAFEPMAGIENERIIETIRPTIYYMGTQVQIGEVIVGTPLQGDRDNS